MVRDRKALWGDVDFKNRLLKKYEEEKYSEGHIRNVRVKLRTIGKWEEEYGKDLYNFTQAELENMLYAMKLSSISNARFLRNIIETYKDFAKLENKGNLSLSIENLLSGDKMDKYVSVAKEKGKTIDRKELDNIVGAVVNYRDKAILELLWLGVMGDEYKELRHLKRQDIDFEKKTIYIRETDRIIENIRDNVLKILKEALEVDEYYANNGVEGSTRVRKFVDSDYICRGTRRNRNGDYPPYLSIGSFLQNFYNLKSFFPDKPYVTGKNVYKSGMIHYFNEYLKEHSLEPSREAFNEFVKVNYASAYSDTAYYDFVRYYNSQMGKNTKSK